MTGMDIDRTGRVPLLRIGPFARASGLSVKALRAYHESGLLVPEVVDPETGYRSYSAAQLTDAAVIARLRHLDVPLAAIRDVLVARDPEVTRKVLHDHSAALEARVVDMRRAIDELYAAVENPSLQTPVHRRREPARTVLAVECAVAEEAFPSVAAHSWRLLVKVARSSGAVIDGPIGGCFPTPLDDSVEADLFVPVTAAPLLSDDVRAAGVRVAELPAVDVAVLVHHGSYDTIMDTYRRLGEWVAAHDETLESAPSRELFLVNAADTDDEDEYRTEICWPVTGTSSP